MRTVLKPNDFAEMPSSSAEWEPKMPIVMSFFSLAFQFSTICWISCLLSIRCFWGFSFIFVGGGIFDCLSLVIIATYNVLLQTFMLR